MIAINKAQAIEVTINEVMSELSKTGFAKTGLNKEQNYKFRSIDEAYSVLSPVLSKHGLFITANSVSDHAENITFGKYENKARHITQKINYIVRHIHNKETIDFMQIGEAIDMSDKGYNKAFTSAYKYMVINFFCLPIDGLDDADANTIELSKSAKDVLIVDKSIKPTANRTQTAQVDLKPRDKANVPSTATKTLVMTANSEIERQSAVDELKFLIKHRSTQLGQEMSGEDEVKKLFILGSLINDMEGVQTNKITAMSTWIKQLPPIAKQNT
jgi:hypothetical protein